MLAAGLEFVGVGFGRRLGEPQSDTEINQGSSQRYAAFAADGAVAALVSGFVLHWRKPRGAVDLTRARPPSRIAKGSSIIGYPHHAPARHRGQGGVGTTRQQGGQGGFSGLDLIVEISQQVQVGGQYLASDHSVSGGQCIAGRGDQTFGDRTPQLQVPGRGETDQPVDAECSQACRVAELGGDQPADPGTQYVGQCQGQSGKRSVELTEQLVLRRRTRTCQMVCVAVAPDEWSSIDGCDR